MGKIGFLGLLALLMVGCELPPPNPEFESVMQSYFNQQQQQQYLQQQPQGGNGQIRPLWTFPGIGSGVPAVNPYHGCNTCGGKPESWYKSFGYGGGN